MIEFVLGRAGTGKTTYIESKLWQGDKVFYLVPEQASMQKERAMQLAAAEKGKPMPTVITFRRLCDMLMRRYGGMARQKMGTVAQYALIYRAVQQCESALRFYQKSVGTFSFYQKLASAYDKFSMYGIRPPEMEEALAGEAENLQNKYRDLLMVYETYEALREEKYRDAEDDMDRAIKLLREHSFFADAHLYIDGFYGFTPKEQQLLVLMMAQTKKSILAVLADDKDPLFSSIRKELFFLQRALLEKGCEVSCQMIEPTQNKWNNNLDLVERQLFGYALPKSKAPRDAAVAVREHKNQMEEISFVAAEIRHKVLSGEARYRDIALLCADMESYEQTVRTVFEAQQIPLFVDTRADLMAKPLIAFILYAIDTAEYNFRFEDVFSFAKTALTGLSFAQTAKLENYVKLWNIQGNAWIREAAWTKNPMGLDRPMDAAAKEMLADLDGWRRVISVPLARFKAATEEGPASRHLTALWQLCTDFSVEKRLQQMAETYYQNDPMARQQVMRLYEIWIDLLDELATVLGDTVIDRKTLQSILKVCLSEVDIGTIPPTMDQVTVGQVSHARLEGVKYIYLLGVNQGVLPSFPARDSLITDADIAFFRQKGIILSKESPENAEEQQYRLYGTLCKATEGIYFSFVRVDAKGNELLPSEYIERLGELIDFSPKDDKSQSEEYYLTHASAAIRFASSLPKGSAARKAWRDALKRTTSTDIDVFLPKESEGKLSLEAVRSLYSQNISMSQSRMQSFVDCPFKYFLQYGLSLQEDGEATFDAANIGTFLHYGLEHFLDWYNGREDAATPWECEQTVDGIVDAYLQNEMKDMDSAKVSFLAGRLRKVLHLATESVTDELAKSRFVPAATEMDISDKNLKLPLENGFSAKINGIIDRVDCGKVEGMPYYKIVDYKSGDKKFSLEKIYNGYDLQLPLYAYACSRLPEFEDAKLAAMEYLHVGVPKYKLEKNIPSPEERESMVTDGLPSQFYRSGIFHSDPQVLQAMEAGTDGKYTVRYTTKGIPRSDAPIVGDDGLQNLMQFAKEKTRQIGCEIARGKIDAEPFKIYHNSCEYCGYHALCRFDYATHKYRKYTKKSEIDFSEMLGNDTAEKGEV